MGYLLGFVIDIPRRVSVVSIKVSLSFVPLCNIIPPVTLNDKVVSPMRRIFGNVCVDIRTNVLISCYIFEIYSVRIDVWPWVALLYQ